MEKTVVRTKGLTELEIKILNAGRKTNFGDCMEDAQWSFAVCDEAGMDEKVYRGVVSSLVKKGLVGIYENITGENKKAQFRDMVFGYTEEAKKLFEVEEKKMKLKELVVGMKVSMKSTGTTPKKVRKQIVEIKTFLDDEVENMERVMVIFEDHLYTVKVSDISHEAIPLEVKEVEPTVEKTVETPDDTKTPEAKKPEAKKPVSKEVSDKCFGIFEKYLLQNGWNLTEKNTKYLWRAMKKDSTDTNPTMLAEIAIEAFEHEGIKKEDITAVIRGMRKGKKAWTKESVKESMKATK